MEKLNPKMAKLAKETDDNIIGESFIASPEKNLVPKLGVLFGIIQIYNQNDTFIEGFLEAINDLKTEYYLPPYNLERGIEKRFEEALARANRRLLQAINSSIDEIDLRQVAAVLGVVLDKKVFFANAGRAAGLFCRRKKNADLLILDVLNTSQEMPPPPAKDKLFANILSGEINGVDAMIFANGEIYNGFTINKLAEIIIGRTAAESAKNLEEQLQEKLPKDNLYAVIIGAGTEPTEIDAASEALPTALPSRQAGAAAISSSTTATKTLARPSTAISGSKPPTTKPMSQPPVPPATSKTAPRTQQSLDRLLYTQARTERYLTPSLLPNWKKIILLIYGKSKIGLNWLYRQIKNLSVKLIKKIVQAASRPAKQLPLIEPIADQNLTPKQSEREELEELEESPKIDPVEEPVLENIISHNADDKKIAGIINAFLNDRIEFFLNLKKTQQIILVSALVLLFIFSQSIVMIGRSYDQTDISPTNKSAKDIENLLNTAEAKNIFNDEPGALQALKEARQLLAQMPNKNSTKAVRAELQQKIDTSAQVLQKIRMIANPPIAADLSGGQTAGDLIGLGKTGRVFWVFDNNNRSFDRFDPQVGKIEIRTSTLAVVKRITAADDKTLIAQTAGGLYKYDVKNNTATALKTSKNYFAVKYDALDFSSPLFDPALSTSTIAMSLTSGGNLFLLDSASGRVIIFDNKNVLLRQYESPAFVGAEALTASLTDKKVWVSKNGKIYLIDLDF